MSSSDPLSYFAAGGSDSSSSDSEDEARENKEENKEDLTEKGAESAKLPSPDSVFAAVGKPSFLYDPTSGKVDWDKFVKNDTDPNVHASEGYAAIAPPTGDDFGQSRKVHSSLTTAIANTFSTTSGEISAPPVRYTTKDVDPKFRVVSDQGGEEEEESVAGKRESIETSDSNSSAKKQKMETFRQKEKRKRDVGQTSRGKSYVEEEKRILRQTFSTDEVMS